MRIPNKLHVPALMITILTLVLSSCMKDKITRTYTMWVPVLKTLAEFRATIKSGPATPVGVPGKMTVYGNYIYLTEQGTGIHVIDNSDPANPKNISFINIPGNEDIAIRGSILYADAYSDLISFDISNPAAAEAKNYITNVFPDHSNYIPANNVDGYSAVMSWVTKDTTVVYEASQDVGPILYSSGCAGCAMLASSPTAASGKAPVGTNGSIARFSIVGNYLYAVGYSNLTTFDISNSIAPLSVNSTAVDWHVKQFTHSKTNFLWAPIMVYTCMISPRHPGQPEKKGEFTHVRGCDPVVADDDYAYVTINDSSALSRVQQ